MIPQFKEYIEEGLWSKGIDRSKSGEKRLGDITDFDKYVPTIKWVDMGHPEYLFAEYDFEKRGMTANEIEHLKLPEGVSMMSSDVFKELCKIKDIFKRATSVDNDITYKDIKFENKITGNKIYFSISDFSYISNLDMFDDEFSVDIISTASKNTKLNKYESYEADKPLFRIKLIKQKSMNEGLWSKGVERSQTGEERLGDKVNSNIKELKEIDLGFDFVFADKNLILNGEEELSYDDIKHYIEYIQNNGWRLMTREDAKTASKLSPEHSDILFSVNNNEVRARLKNTDEYLSLPLSSQYTYYMLDKIYDDGRIFSWVLCKTKHYVTGRFNSAGTSKLVDCNEKIFVRLVKDKKMNEGLWSKGVDRSKTGEIRIGDLNEIDNYIRNVKWVDLGHPKYLFGQKDLPSSPEKLDELLSLNEIGELIKKLPEGVGIIDLSLLNWIKNNCKVYSFYSGLKYENVEKNDYSYLNADVYYFLKGTHRSLSTDNHADVYINHLTYNPIGKYRPTIKNEFNEDENNKKCYCVKLIKLKSMNEGLWAKGVNRSQTGEERIENTNPQFERYLQNIEWMNMGTKDKLYAKVDFNEGMSINQIKNLKLPEGVEIMSGVDFYMLKGLCDISKN